MLSKKTHVSVISSGFECGNTATIHVDGAPLLQIPRQGFNVLVLSPVNNTWQTQVPTSFDTHEDPAADDELGSWLHQLSQNDDALVVMAVCDDAANKLSEKTRSLIATVLGSKLISKLTYRGSFALVARIGDGVASEAVSGNTKTSARVDAYIDAPEQHGLFVSASSAGFNTGADSFAQVGLARLPATDRGLNVVEIDETTGYVLNHQVFDTFAKTAASESFAEYIGSLPNNRIVIVFVRGEAFRNLTAHAIAASESLGGDHLDELAFRDSYVLIGCKGWTPCFAYEPVPGSSVITVSCSFDIPELPAYEAVFAETQTPTHAYLTSSEPLIFLAEQSPILCQEQLPFAEEYSIDGPCSDEGEHFVEEILLSPLCVANTQTQPLLRTGHDDQHQIDVETLSGLIEGSSQFKSVALALQRADDFPTDQEAFQAGQNALKSVWRQTLLNVNVGGVNETNMTLLKKVFKFEHGVIVINSKTNQPIFAEGSSDLIIGVINNVRAAADAAKNTVPETETLRLMRSAFGQSDAKTIQSELLAVSILDNKLRLALADKIGSARETLSKAMDGSLAAHTELEIELQRKISSANDSVDQRKRERVEILSNIDRIDQAFGEILSENSDLNLDSLIKAVDPDSRLGVAFDAIEEHFKRWSEAQKSKLGEVEILDELKKQLQTFIGLVNAKEREFQQEQQRIDSLEHTITVCKTNIESLRNDQAAATTKRDEANIELQTQQSRRDVLKQVLRDTGDVSNTKTISDVVYTRLRSSVNGASKKVDQLRAACTEHANGKTNLINAKNRVDELQRNRQNLSQIVSTAVQYQQSATQYQNSKLNEYANEADRVVDGKGTKANPRKQAKYDEYLNALLKYEYSKNEVVFATNRLNKNEAELGQANSDQIWAQKHLDGFAPRISDLCSDVQSLINSQNVEAINAELVAKTNVALFQKQIDDAVSSINTNIAKEADANATLPKARIEIDRAEQLLMEYKERVRDINQQISSGEVNYQKPTPVISSEKAEEANKKAKLLMAEREAASMKLQSIDEQLFVQQQYICKLTTDLETERQIISELSRDDAAVSAAILESEQIFKRDIEGFAADFNEQLNANIAAAGFSAFGAWNTNEDSEIRGQSLLRCLVSHVRGLLRPCLIGDDPDVMFAAEDVSDVQKSSVENLVKKLLKKYPSIEMSGSTAYDLATALINEEFSADATYQQISSLEIHSSSNNSDGTSVFIQNLLKRPAANVLLYNASESFISNLIELRPLSTSDAIDAVEFLKTLSRYASSSWSIDSLVSFLANLLLRKPVGDATIEELGGSIRSVQAMHGNVELTANRLQEAINPVVADYNNPNYKLDPVTQLGLRLMDRLFGTRTAIIQAESSHIDSTSDELILLSTGINSALQNFIDKLSRSAMHFLQNEIQRRRDAILSGSESAISGETADRISELNSAIDQQAAALESKKAELRKLASLMDNKDKQAARVAAVTDELKRIQERIEKLSNVNTEKLAELSMLRENMNQMNAEKEKLLNDIQSRRDEIAKLKSERASVERKLSLARDAADEAAKLYNAAQVDVRSLQAKLETTQKLLADSKAELEDMTRWSAFVKAVRDAINTDFDVIRMRSTLTKEYQDIRLGNTNDVFPWLSRSLPKLSDEANYWASRNNALWASDICSKVLDDKLYSNPNLSLQIGVAFTISGPSLSYSEIFQLLRGWAVARLEPLGLALDTDDNVYVKVPAVVPGFITAAMPEPLQALFANRIQRFYRHKQGKPGNTQKHWDDQLRAPGLDAARYYTEMVNAGYGANLMDIVLAFAPTVEILTGFNLLIDVDVKLPGINFYVTCAGNTRVDANITIDTSAAKQPKLRFDKARNGSDPDYKITDGLPYGRDGDDGLDGAAGFNGGHITIQAQGSIIGGGAITVRTHGEKGHDGQIGGDGDAGRKGYTVPNADAPDTSSWYRNMTIGIARYPGQDQNRKFPPEGGYPNEISGNGGNGGISGLGGEGGEGGDVNIVDSDQKLSFQHGEGNYVDHLKDSSLIRISTMNSELGKDPPGASGGPGGQPGQRGLDEVKSKSSFWVKTRSTVCTIDVDSKEFKNAFEDSDWINWVFDPFVVIYRYDAGERFNRSFGWTRTWKGVAMSNVPKITDEAQDRNRVDSRSIGKAGTASLSASEEISQHQRQQCQQHQNVSTLSNYQRKMYAAAQTMQVGEQYLALETEYSQREQQLSQSTKSLQQANDQTINEQQAATKSVEQAHEQCKQAEQQLNTLMQQQRDVEAMYMAQADKLNAAEIKALAMLASSLALTKEAAQLQKEIQGNQIDSEMSQKQTAMIREVVAAVEAQLATKQAQWLAQKQQMEREIAALTRSIAASRLKKDQVVQAEQLAGLDRLLSQLSSMDSKQQQQQQQSMQSEADLESDSSSAGENMNVLVRTYFRRDEKGVWSFLTSAQASRLEHLLSAMTTEIPDVGDHRLVALECLELLMRYGIYTETLDGILQECEKGPRTQTQDDQLPLKPSDLNLTLGPRLAAVFQGHSQEIRLNHRFCVSLSGVSIGQSPDSTEFLKLYDVSLQARYDEVAPVPASMKLTAFEQYARRIILDLRKKGPEIAEIAALLKRYSSEFTNAQLNKGSGLMALYEGRPVPFLDQMSRTILLYVGRHDDTLVKSKLEIIFVAAHTISDIANSLGIPMLVNIVKRKRDMRGELQPPTTQLLANLELAQQHFDEGRLDEAMAALRSNKLTVLETKQSPQSTSELVALIKSLSDLSGVESVVTERLAVIARVIGTGVVVRSDSDIKIILNALGEIGITRPELNLTSCVSSAAVAYISAISPGPDFVSRIQESLNIRLSTPSLETTERVKRITAFCNIAKQKFESGEKTEIERVAACETLSRSSVAYALYSVENMEAIQSVSKMKSAKSEDYAELVENLAYDITSCNPELLPRTITSNAETLLPSIIAARKQAPIMKDLANLAISSAKSTIIAEILEQLKKENDIKLNTAYIRKKSNKFNLSNAIDNLDVLSEVLKQLQHQEVNKHWMTAICDPTTEAGDLHRILVALLQNSDLSATVEALVIVYSTASTAQLSNWRELLELSLVISVNTVIDKVVSYFESSDAQETTLVGYMSQVVTAALRDPATDSDTPSTIRVSALNGLLSICDASFELKKTVSKLKAINLSGPELNDKIFEAQLGCIYQLVVVAHEFGTDSIKIGRAPPATVAANQVKTETDKLRDKIATLLLDVGQMLPTDVNAAKRATYRLNVLYSCFHICSGSDPSFLIDNAAAINVAQTYLTAKSVPQNIRDASSDILVRIIRAVENRLVSLATNDVSKRQKTIDSITEAARSSLLVTKVANVDLIKLIQAESDRRVQMWRTMLLQFEDLNSAKSELDRLDSLNEVITKIQKSKEADNIDDLLASAVNSELVSLRSKKEYKLPALFSQSDSWGIHAEKMKKIIKAIHLAPDSNFHDYVVAACQAVGAHIVNIMQSSEADNFEDGLTWVLDHFSNTLKLGYFPRDNEHQDLLPDTIRAISQLSLSAKTDELFNDACRNLCNVLCLCDFQRASYSQVDLIKRATFEDSNLSVRLKMISDAASKVFDALNQAITSDVVLADNQNRAFNLVEAVRISQNFASDCVMTIVENVNQLVDAASLVASPPVNMTFDEAVKAVLALPKVQNINLATLSIITKALSGQPLSAQLTIAATIVSRSFVQCIKSIVGYAHFAMGRAIDSDYNEELRSTDDEQERAMREYKTASDYGCLQADSNIAFIDFVTKQETSSYEKAKQETLPVFRDLASKGDANAKRNVELLEVGQTPTSGYEFCPPASMSSIDRAEAMATFRSAAAHFVEDVMRIINGVGPLTSVDGIGVLAAIFSSLECEDYANFLKDMSLSLEQQRDVLLKFAECLANGIATAPLLAKQGVNIVAKDISSLKLESEDLIPCGALFMCMRPQLLPSDLNLGSIIKAIIDSDASDKMSGGLRVSYILFAGALLKRHVENRLALMQADLDKRIVASEVKSPNLDSENVNFELLNRTKELFFVKLKAVAETLNSETTGKTDKQVSTIVQLAQDQVRKVLPLICDCSSVNLGVDGSVMAWLKDIGIKDLMSLEEISLAQAVGDDLATAACHDGLPSNSTLRNPATWESYLRRTWIISALTGFTKQSLDRSIQAVAEPVVKYGKNLRLKRLDNELTKIKNAYESLAEPDLVENIERIENAYQDILNFSYYILYLTTTEYILSEMVPAPGPNAKKEELADYEKAIENVTPSARELVKKIKVACDSMIDLFGGAKLVHENLIAATTVWTEANLFNDLISVVSSVISQPQDNNFEGLQHFMWMLSKDKPDFLLRSMRYKSSIGSTYFTTIIHRIADNLASYASGSTEKEEFNNRLSNIVSWLESGALPDDKRGWKYTKLVFVAITQTAQRPGKDVAIHTLLTFKQIKSILDALELSIKCEAWSSQKLIDRLQSLTNMDSWVPLLENQCIKLSLGYDELNTSEEDEKEFDRAVAGIVRLSGRRGELVGSKFQSCLCELLKLAKPKTLADIAERVASNIYKFSTSDSSMFETAGKLETSDEMMNRLSEFYEKLQSDQPRSATRLVGIMQEETNIGGMNEGVSKYFSSDSSSAPNITLMEQRLLAIDAIYKAKFATYDKQQIVAWSKQFRTERAVDIFRSKNIDGINEMLAVFQRVVHLHSECKYFMRIPQMMSVILFVDAMYNGKSRIGEIGTGEGKSLIVVLCAATRIFMGQRVDVLSSNEVLAKRDAIEALGWMKYFGISVSNNCDEEAENDEKERTHRYSTNEVIYGEAGYFQRDVLLTRHFGKKIRGQLAPCVIVDEVDSMFIDTVGNTLYISHSIEDLKLLSDVFIQIWTAVHGSDATEASEANVAKVSEFIKNQIATGALLVPNQLHDFTVDRIEIWVRSAYQAKIMAVDDQYTTVSSGKRRGEVVVMDLYSGVEQMTTRWSNGLHQFIQIKHNNRLSPESLKAIFMANLQYFKEYGNNIIGMTGTIGGRPERQMLASTYGCDFFRMPRYKEENFHEDPPVIAGNRSRWLELVSEEAANQAIYGRNYGFDVSKDAFPPFDIDAAEKDLKSDQLKLEMEQKNLNKATLELSEAKQRLALDKSLQRRLNTIQKDLQPTTVLSKRDLDTLAKILDEITANTTISPSKIENKFIDQQAQCSKWLKTTLDSLGSLKVNEEQTAKLKVDLENTKTQIAENDLKIKNASSPAELTELKDSQQKQQTTALDLTLQLRSHEDQSKSLQKATLDASKTLLSTCSELLKQASDSGDKEVLTLALNEAAKRSNLTDLKVKVQANKDAIQFGGGRSVLIICRNKLDAKDVANTLMNDQRLTRIFVYHGTIEGVTEVDCKTRKTLRTQVKLKDLSPRDIIVSTNIAGRGLSLGLTKPVKKCGGLHVVISFVPENVRVEAQAWGRAARQGDPGSGRFVICEPNLTALSGDVSMAYLLMERDTNEQQRLDVIMTETVPRIDLEKSLFDAFALLTAELEKIDEFQRNNEEQQIALRDRWAFFLEQQGQDLEDIFKDPENIKKRINRAFQTFCSGVLMDVRTCTYGLIKDPGNLIRIVHAALKDNHYQKAIEASEAIVRADPRFGAYGYYYKALALFGSGTDDMNCKAEAMSLLNNAVTLFNRNIDMLQSQSQVVKALNDNENKKGKGTGPDYFTQGNSNTASMLQVHVNAAQDAIGYAISESNFNDSTISGDLTKDVYNIITSEPALQNILLPFRLGDDLEIRVLLDIQDRNKASKWLNGRTKDVDYSISGNTAKLQGCTTAELNEFEGDNVTFELQLVRRGNTLSGAGDMPVSFPEQFSYAAQKIIHNIHVAAVNKTKSSLKFETIADRSKLNDWIFAPLIKEEEAKAYFSALGDGDEQEYLVVNYDWRSAVMGRWDETGFHGIGIQLRDWFVNLVDKQSARHVSTSVALTKAAEFLTANKQNPNLSQDAIDTMACRGVVTKQKFIAVKSVKEKVISDYDDIIQVSANPDEATLQKLDLSGYSLLQNKRTAVLDVIRTRRGKEMRTDDLYKALQCSEEEASDAFVVLKALLRHAGLDTYLCERLNLNVQKEHREPLDTALERIKFTIKANAWESVGKHEELRNSLISQHVILQPQVGPRTYDKIGYSNFLSSGSHVDRVKKAVGKYCEKSIRDFVKKIKTPDQNENDTVEQFISDIKTILEKSIGQLVKDASKELKVSLKTLTDNIDKKSLPPELIDFFQSCSEIVFSVEVKTSWWDWNAFAVAMIGLVQVVAGAALLVLSAGTATHIANALIGEGIGDMIYATQAGLTGTFSWKEWGKQKGISMAISIATAGVGAFLSRGAHVAQIGFKVTASVVMKAVAKKILGQILQVATNQFVSYGANKLAGIVTQAVFNAFRKDFSSWIRDNAMAQNSINNCKKELTRIVQYCGPEKAKQYLIDAVQKSMTDVNLKNKVDGEIESHGMNVAKKLGDNLKIAGDRLKYSSSNKAKLLGTISNAVSYLLKAGKVVLALKRMVEVVPLVFNDLNKRLQNVRLTSVQAQQTLMGESEAATIADKLMQDHAVSQILAQIQSIAESKITSFAFSEALSYGVKPLTDRIGKLGDDYKALHNRALALGELRSMRGHNALEKSEVYREKANFLEKEMNKSCKYESPLEDLKDKPNTVVRYMGRKVKISEVRDWVGDSGLKALPAADGTLYLMRSDISNYVNSLSVIKRSNLADLHIYAAAAGIDIKLLHHDTSFNRNVTKLIRSATADTDTGGTRPVVTLKLVTDSNHPDGHYVMMKKNTTTGALEPVEGLVSIGNSCAPQQLVYFKALHSGETETRARELANKKENVDEFLSKAKELAKTDKRVAAAYYDRKQDVWPNIIGGAFKNHPEKKSEGLLRKQMELENQVNKFMIVKNARDFEYAYKRYFGEGKEFEARDVTRYLLVHTNPDGSSIIDNSLDWVKTMVDKDPQFLSKSPVDQHEALCKAGYGASQTRPLPQTGMPNVKKAGKTWMTTKSFEWNVDFDDWGLNILGKYAVAVVNLSDHGTRGFERTDNFKSSTKRLRSDDSAINLALSQLKPEERLIFLENLRQRKQKLAGYTWHHAGHAYGRMLLVPFKIHDAFKHTGWDSVLADAKISDSIEFNKQRDLGRAMDAYSGYGAGDNEVGKFYRPKTGSSNPDEPLKKRSYTSMTQLWMAETTCEKD